MFPIPPGTQALLWMNIAAFVLDWLMPGAHLRDELALWPIGSGAEGGVGFTPWQLLTYSFFHGNFAHIFFNMFGLVMFGGEIERVWGRNRFLTYYFVCVVSAALAQLAFSAVIGSNEPAIGASGGIFGLLLAFAVLFPDRKIILLIFPVPMPAWLFVTLYGLLELVQGVTGTEAGVAHFAHLGGMLGGWLLLRRGMRRH